MLPLLVDELDHCARLETGSALRTGVEVGVRAMPTHLKCDSRSLCPIHLYSAVATSSETLTSCSPISELPCKLRSQFAKLLPGRPLLDYSSVLKADNFPYVLRQKAQQLQYQPRKLLFGFPG